MNEFLEQLKKIDGVSFPFEGFQSLTEFIHVTSRQLGVPYSAYRTHRSNNAFFSYCCTFGGRSRARVRNTVKCEYVCPSILKFAYFMKNDTYFFFFCEKESILTHSHPTNREFYEAHRNLLSNEQINEIINQQKAGVQPAAIRANTGITINSNIFYNIRRKAILNNKNKNQEIDQDQIGQQIVDFNNPSEINENGQEKNISK